MIERSIIRRSVVAAIPIIVATMGSGCSDLSVGKSASTTSTARIPWTETEPVDAPRCEDGESFHRAVPGTLAQLAQWSDGVVVGRVVSQRTVTMAQPPADHATTSASVPPEWHETPRPQGVQHVESSVVVERSLAGRFQNGETVRMWSTGNGEPGNCDPTDIKPAVGARYLVFLVRAAPLGNEPAPDAYWPFGGAATARFRVDANDLVRSDTGPGRPLHDEIVLKTIDEIAVALRR